jgi:hypothetical protein
MEMHNSSLIPTANNGTISVIGGRGVSSGGIGRRSANNKGTTR